MIMDIINYRGKGARIYLLLFLLSGLCFPSLQAQDSIDYKWERFSFSFGGFLTSISNDISISGQGTGLGLNINLEEALDLIASSLVIRSEAEFNFGSRRRSYVRMGYFGLFRSSRKVLEADLEIGNSVIPVGTEVNTKYNMQIIRALYDYAVYKDERVILALSAGLYILPVDFSIGTSVILNEAERFVAPLPVLGFRSTFNITPKLLIKQNIEFLYLKLAYFEGSISDLNLYLEYNPFKHFGLGLGYNAFRFNLKAYADTGIISDFQGAVNTGFNGLLFYGKFYF